MWSRLTAGWGGGALEEGSHEFQLSRYIRTTPTALSFPQFLFPLPADSWHAVTEAVPSNAFGRS